MALALFDLDHTLLSGDSDLLWCEFLVEQGLLDPSVRIRSAAVAAAYTAGTIAPIDICSFSASTLAGHTPAALAPLRERFFRTVILPRIPPDARDLLQRHRDRGDILILTTATNRVVSELTALELQVDHYLCTELALIDGCYTGLPEGTLNMRAGKLVRLREWLAGQGLAEQQMLKQATFYSDSINDLALLSAVGRPVVVDPDPRLESTALRKGWSVLRFQRSRFADFL